MAKKLPRPFKRWTTYQGHSGIDYPVPDNTMVKASGNGTVVFSGYYSARGGYAVHVLYDTGIKWGYYHSDKGDWRIAQGKKVKLGTPIMEVGGTGQLSTGPHLHQDVWVNGSIIYPPGYWAYVDQSENGYVGAGSSAGGGGKPFPLPEPEEFKQEEEIMYFTWIDEKGKQWWAIATFDDAQKIEQSVAIAYNAVRGNDLRFIKVAMKDASTVLNNIRALRERRNNGIADATVKAIDEMLVDSH